MVFCKARFFLQAQELDRVKALVLGQKGEQLRRQRPLVGGVDVEAGGTHQQVFGVGGFEDEQAAGRQHAVGLGKQGLQNRKG